MSEQPPSRAALITAFATIYVVWGSTYLGIRVAVETLPPFLMAGARFLVSGGLMVAWVAWQRGFRPTRRQWLDNSIIGGLLLLGGNGLVSWAEQKVPSGIATLIISIGPVFIVLLDWLVLAVGRDPQRGSRPNAAIFLGLALGFAGLAVLVGPDVRGGGSLDPWRVLGLLVACLSWSVGSIYSRYARDPAEPFTAAAMQQVAGCVWVSLVSLLLGEPFRFDVAAVSMRSVAAWAYLVVAGSLVGFTTFVWLMKHSSPAKVSTYAYVNPVVAVFLGWLVLDEPVSPRIFLGAAVIIGGVAIITTAKNLKAVGGAAKAGRS